jgi:ABC-type nickel/cobalt efflux system permease component RcnA
MPKALCLISLVASILIVVLFLADAAMGMAGMTDVAPLQSASIMMDITYAILGGALVYMSWKTYREQR